MRHFFRTQLNPSAVMTAADGFFPAAPVSLHVTSSAARARSFSGDLGSLTLMVTKEGGHYTLVEADTDQMGESRLDRNVKRFFVGLHRMEEPRHAIEAAY
jgi:hypothetical protein